jgi:16S rRNA (guanine527-N7)-methyltransferase
MTTRLRLREADRDHLVAAAAGLGIELTPRVVTDLCRFADVLDLWSSKTNLISCRSPRELVDRHLLDSLAVAQTLPDESAIIVDLGSGAGFPGLPLAILRTDLRFILVEVRRRRASFLNEVRRTLRLPNVEVLEQRAEHPPQSCEHAAAAVVSRAVWSDDELMTIAKGWLAPNGVLVWMRSDPLQGDFSSDLYRREVPLQYRIEANRRRYIEVLRR